MLRIYILIFCIILILTTVYKREGFESPPATLPKTPDPRCYVNGTLIGTPHMFSSGYEGLIYTNDECNKLGGIYKYITSLPIGQGLCYSHETKLGDSYTYNILCGDKSVPKPVEGEQRCYVAGVGTGFLKLGYLDITPGLNNEPTRIYNKRECSLLKGKYHPKTENTGICMTQNGKITDGIITNNFSLFCNT
jgi:hypothetical protein